MSQRAVSVQELVLRPRHAASAGAIAPLWPRLAGSLRTLDLSLERELPDYQPQVSLPPWPLQALVPARFWAGSKPVTCILAAPDLGQIRLA